MQVSAEEKVELFNHLKQLAKKNGFKLLEPKWLGNREKHRFLHIESGEEHQWTPPNLKKNGFPKLDYEYLKEIGELAEKNGFKLLEPEWLGAGKKHRFLHIKSGEEIQWVPSDLKRNGFPKLDYEKLKELAELAEESGFNLLEPVWLGDKEKHRFLHFESGKEYQWVPSQLKQAGFPLTEGQRYLTQEVCRQAFVHIFGGEFQSNRERLKPLHGKSLELDGYQEFGEPIPGILVPYAKADKAEVAFNLQNLQIAFEYQGHEGHRNDEGVMERDRLRVEYCRQEGILLVVIDPPAQQKFRNSEYMYAHVTDAIRVAMGQPNLEFPQGFEIDLSNWNADKKAHAELNELAKENGFKLLEPKWLGAKEKHRFLHIESGKECEWTPRYLKQNGFPKDLRTDEDQYHELIALTEGSGFKLLEPKWLGAKEKHRFLHIESGKEHQWIPNKLKQSGFPKDLRTDEDHYRELIALTEGSGFKLLETKWLGDREKHRFLHVESGQKYEGAPSNLKRKGFPKRFTQSQAPLPKQPAAEPAPTSAIDQIASQLKALKSDVTLSKAEKQAAMNACAAELAALMPPCPYDDEPPHAPATRPIEPASNDEPEVEMVRQRMTG